MSIQSEQTADRSRAASDRAQYDQAPVESEEDLINELHDVRRQIESEIEEFPEVGAIRERYADQLQSIADRLQSIRSRDGYFPF